MSGYQVTLDVPNTADRNISVATAEPFSPHAGQPLLHDSSSKPHLPVDPLLGDSAAAAAVIPASVSPGDMHYHPPIKSSDIMWGSQVLDILEHPSVVMAGLAFMIIIALQDVSMIIGLITGSAVMILDLLTTLIWRVTHKLRHWPYALTHCFMWPLLTWSVLTLFFQQGEYHLWLNVFLWGSVSALMSMTVLYGYPFSRDIMKEKSPQVMWDEPWWTDLANSLANTWIILFATMCGLSLIPTLVDRSAGRQMDHILNVIFNYLAPLFLAAVGITATRSVQDKARSRWLLAPGATATAGAGAGAAIGGGGSTGGVGRIAVVVPPQAAVVGYEPLPGSVV